MATEHRVDVDEENYVVDAAAAVVVPLAVLEYEQQYKQDDWGAEADDVDGAVAVVANERLSLEQERRQDYGE